MYLTYQSDVFRARSIAGQVKKQNDKENEDEAQGTTTFWPFVFFSLVLMQSWVQLYEAWITLSSG